MKKLLAFLLAAMCCVSSSAALADEVTADTAKDETVAEEVVAEDVAEEVVTEEEVLPKDPNAITVMVKGTELIADVPAQIIDDRTMLPMRAIFERLGAKVTWMQKNQSIFASKGATLIVMQIGSTDLLISDFNTGDKNVVLDVVPQIVEDRTLVPVRAVAEALGCKVEWDGDTRTVTITE